MNHHPRRSSCWEQLLPGLSLRFAGPIPPPAPGPDPDRLVADTLDEARFDAFLADLIGRGPVTFVINDPDRPLPPAGVLAALVARADRAGLSDPLRLLVATGSHRFERETRARHEARVLGTLGGRFRSRRWHDADDREDLASVGPCRLHRWIVEGAGAIAIGSAEPHYFAGVTGAHKTLTVGLMGIDDLRENHRAAMLAGAEPLRTTGNPVFEGIAEAIKALERSGRRLFAVNLILVDGGLAACVAGRPLEALERGLRAVRSTFVHEISAPVELIVASVSPPLDRCFYQADKGLKNVESAVRDGGVILLDAACSDGIGIDRFLEILGRAEDESGTLALIRSQGYVLGDHKAVRLRHLTDTRGVRVGIISRDMPPATAGLLHAAILPDRRAAASWALDHLPGTPQPTGMIVEDAGNVVVRVLSRSGEG